MARVSIYVPDAMKARMDAFGDRVNWSSIAQSAFELDLASRIEVGDATMQTVIERLKASKNQYEQHEKQRGSKDGKDWAMNFAPYVMLKRLSKIDIGDLDENCGNQLNQHMGVEQIDDGSFCFNHETRDLESDEYVVAWVEAALEVWDAAGARL